MSKNPVETMMPFIRKHNQLLVALAFSIWGLFLRFRCLAQRELWFDETVQLKNTLGRLKPFWQQADYGELTSFPGEYLLTYPFVNWAPDNKWIMAIPHMIAMFLSFWVMYLLCRRYITTAWGTAIAFAVFVINANLVFHALELRPYPVLILLGPAVFYLTEMIVSSQYKLSGLQKFWIGFAFFLTIQFHAYGVLILFFATIFCILKEWRVRPLWDVIRHIFKFYAIFSVLSLPLWVWYVTGKVPVYEGVNTFAFIADPRINPVGFFKGVFGNLLGWKWFYPLLLGIPAAFVLSPKDRWLQVLFFLMMVAMPLTVLCLLDLDRRYWFIQRQFIWIMPLFALLLGWCWDSCFVWAQGKRSLRGFKNSGHSK